MAKLEKQYDAKTTPSKISKSTDLVGTRSKNVWKPIPTHIGNMSALIGQLKTMITTIDEPLADGLLVIFIAVSDMNRVVSAIKTLPESKN